MLLYLIVVFVCYYFDGLTVLQFSVVYLLDLVYVCLFCLLLTLFAYV